MATDDKPAAPAKAPEKKAKPKAVKPAAEKVDSAKAHELKLAVKADEEGEEEARQSHDAPAEEKAKPAKAVPIKKAKAGAPAKKSTAAKAARGRPKPKLDAKLEAALKLRKDKNAHRPEFHREEWFRYQRLGTKWRAPQGIQSKMRRHWGTHADVVSIGYRGPKAARGLHPSGFLEVLIHNAKGLEGLDPGKQAVRIAGSVGRRKRQEIQDGAKKLGIRVLNWRNF